ncbi:MAG: hypothetical protein ISR58_05515 [Anaerolineales bacterium]|nr:hypothetical protein [Chloroflexota bacterium]MBL6980633.1 hypothetical protein [Anaerolineales bacterium]
MQIAEGRITEIISGFNDKFALRIDCSLEMIPAPGEYLLAYEIGDAAAIADSVLAVPLFQVWDSSSAALQPSYPIPSSWKPGSTLILRGPLGHGFKIPGDIRHLALATLGQDISRLLPLLNQFPNTDIALFSNAMLPDLPLVVEAHPLSALPDSLIWADILVMDLPMKDLPKLRQILSLEHQESIPCLAQALILTPMPCGSIAECGVCAVPARKGYKLACKDGPVFDLNKLKW